MAYLIQLVSGILMAMLYLSSEYMAYETLDLTATVPSVHVYL